VSMGTVEIDRDAAREAAEAELAKPIYERGSWMDRLQAWFDALLQRIAYGDTAFPGGWVTLTVLLLVLAAGVVAAVRIARRTMRTNRSGAPLFGHHELTAAEHRATAEQHAAAGDWAAAIRHRLRAVARDLEESGLLPPAPGRTATELARDAGAVLPRLAGEFAAAATVFNDVAYGQRPGTAEGYRLVAALDDRLRARPAVPAGPDGWGQPR